LHEKYAVLRKKKTEVLKCAEEAKKATQPPPLTQSKLPPATAKERVKKLVLTGKIALSANSSVEKTAFKRSKLLEKKLISSSKVITGSKKNGGGTTAVGALGLTKFASKFDQQGGSCHIEGTTTMTALPIMKTYSYEGQNRQFTIPRLNPSTPNVPKRGPAIYVQVKDLLLSETLLTNVFGKFGRIVGIKLTYPGVAFVTFATTENADRAIAEMNGGFHNGFKYAVDFAWRQPHYPMNQSNRRTHDAVETKSAPWLSTTFAGQQGGESTWDYKRRQVVYEDDDDLALKLGD